MSKSRRCPAVQRDGWGNAYVWVLDRLNLSIVDAHQLITLFLVVVH